MTRIQPASGAKAIIEVTQQTTPGWCSSWCSGVLAAVLLSLSEIWSGLSELHFPHRYIARASLKALRDVTLRGRERGDMQ